MRQIRPQRGLSAGDGLGNANAFCCWTGQHSSAKEVGAIHSNGTIGGLGKTALKQRRSWKAYRKDLDPRLMRARSRAAKQGASLHQQLAAAAIRYDSGSF